MLILCLAACGRGCGAAHGPSIVVVDAGPSKVADAGPGPDAGPASSLGVIYGRVTQSGRVARGVRVRLGAGGRLVLPQATPQTTTETTPETTTDDAGRYQLTGVPGGAYTIVAELGVAELGGLGAVDPIDVGLDPEQPTRIEHDLVLVPTAPLAGVVRDAEGKPLGGAFVRIEEEERPSPVEIESGADGRFTAPGRIRGRSYRVSVRRAGYLPDGPRLAKAGGPPLEIRLRRGATLEGLVVDERGGPVAGAEVSVVSEEEGALASAAPTAAATGARASESWLRLQPEGELGVLPGPIPYPPLEGPAPVAPEGPSKAPTSAAPSSLLPRSDGKGGFRIAELPAGRVVVTARHPDYADASSVPVQLVAGQVRTVRIELVRGATLRGRVLDERGYGIADAQITTSDGRTALSDSAGRFVVDHLARSLDLLVRRAGFLKAEARVEVAPGQREALVDVTMRRALGQLGGQVVDARGQAVAGARLVITPRGGEAVRTSSDGGGRFLVQGLPDGPYRLVVEHADFARLSLPAIEASAEARLVLRAGGGIEGEVYDPRTGAPPPDLKLVLESNEEKRNIPVDGRRFRVVGMPSGPARLVASAKGYPRLTLELEVGESDRPGEVTVRDLRLQLELGGQVRGRVRDEHGDPVAGAEVELLSSPGAVDPVRTDRDGGFVMTGVPSGRVLLRARRGESRAGLVNEAVEVRSNEESRVDLTLP